MNATIKGNNLVIEIPLTPARPSSTGKTFLVATTGGYAKTTAVVDGKPVSISVNASIKP